MQLADLNNDNIDPIRVLLTGYLVTEDLTHICSTIRNAPANLIRNNLIDENLIGNLGKAAMLKSKAATLIPSDLRKNPAIAKLIELAQQSEEMITAPAMTRWWEALGKAIGTPLKIDEKALVTAVLPTVTAEGDKLAQELQASQASTNADRSQQDELSNMEKGLKHKQALAALKAKYGGDELDPKVAAERNKAKMKTLARMGGIEGGEDLDYETVRELMRDQGVGGGGLDAGGKNSSKQDNESRLISKFMKSIRKEVKRMKGKSKKSKALKTEDAQKLLVGLARMVIAESPLCEGPKWDKFKAAVGSKWNNFKSAVGSHDYKKTGAGLLSGLTSLFSRGGRDQMGGSAVTGAIKSYLVALAISTMAKAAQSMASKNDSALGDKQPDARARSADGGEQGEAGRPPAKPAPAKPGAPPPLPTTSGKPGAPPPRPDPAGPRQGH